ncbi:MAG: LTA synthase family protein, partial [Oscillospiraceae bacterium]|nr:LTA synthase family protein [Oscillospiraceae bacterium]
MTDNTLVSVLIIVLSIVQYISVEIGAQGKSFLKVKWKYKNCGVCTYIFLNVLLLWITNSVQLAFSISAVLTTVLSVANHYVYDMHGTPFTMDIIKNTGTALNVISAYKIKISRQIWCVTALAAVQLVSVNTAFAHYSAERLHITVWLVMFAVVFCLQYFGKKAAVPKTIVTWPWSRIISETGYICGFVQSTIRLFNIVQPMGDYDEKQNEQFVKEYESENKGEKTPDIMLILNETLYDLNQITDTGEKCLEYILNLENCVKGYTVSPAVGGGTNKSEYELLTSNSLYLAPNITPFYSLDTTDANSVAGFLKSKGYTTMATHPAPGSNYSRTKGYSDLGFDKSIFSEEYTDVQHFGSRMFATDTSMYKNALHWYENMGDGPRFAYLLTIQNHGGYVFNKPEENTVNVSKDYGENTKKVNEFLSCMQLSDDAFKDLIEYFKNSEREVILCMLGDHAPDFAKNVVDEKYKGEEREMLLRKVPFVIWSNKMDLSNVQLPDTIAMPYIVPKLMEIAGVGLSGYYDSISKLSKEIPVITTYGKYVDDNGRIYDYDNKNEHSEKIKRYFDLCYSNIKNKKF